MSVFKFKQFEVNQTNSAMKIGTDAMVFGALIDVSNKKNGLDIGTGTGVLSLMVAQRNQTIKIKAIEIDLNAFQEAKNNFLASPFHSQLEAIHQDVKTFQSNEKFDLIFSNPPYFQNATKSISDERNLARHTDTLSMEELSLKVSEIISTDGDFWIILPIETMQEIDFHLKSLHFFLNQEILIYGKENQLVRKIASYSKSKKDGFQQELIIRNTDNQYTAAYKELTIDYHFNQL